MPAMTDPLKPRPHTLAVHGPGPHAPGPQSTPIVRSSTFSFETLEAMLDAQARGPDGAFYQRTGHPTLRAVERRLAALEGAEDGLLFASGMAAVTAALLSLLPAGGHVVALAQCYGGTLNALRWGAERLGWTFDLVDAREPEGWASAFRAPTRIFHVESPTNPTLCVVDLAAAAALAHRHGALLTVDNTFASPVGQQPLALGADLVVHSATKSIGGHADLLAGAALGSAAVIAEVQRTRHTFGAVPDPATAWLIERSLKTLPLRVERANANALELARRLAADARVPAVHYPGLPGHPGHDVAARQMALGFGHVLSFEAPGGLEGARATLEALRLIQHAPSLGGVETLAVLPALTSNHRLPPEERAAAGLGDGLVRIAVGIEDVEDLWDDLAAALGHGAAVVAGSTPASHA